MATATTVEGFPVPLATNTGWRLFAHQEASLGDFRCNQYGEVRYKGAYVGINPQYGVDVWATALAASQSEASIAIGAMDP
jgi:hypothetical protein